ncbi:FAD/NAD(P)-binding protein [Hymenobacter cellulosilyticus]|uniref:FAD/NAD(P)-binding protein n=1 Tax=Hymenobacter cellulosilyticus TaxID=2932248 RepID=A0A8T9Q8N3_9BACT|nr:FAD/NAD(P)-binding protein [Hymenobacter cellulosilyticus]UOQ71889.1 FAD/NAD(P)-binding protein [Hymenobacter cellulosilyticus]
MSRRTITILGGGFSGSMLMVQLARLPGGPYPVDVHIVEPRALTGPGLAYSARRKEYLLNVRAPFLSAFPQEPNHFIDWLASSHAPACTNGFCSRQTYGKYLQQLTENVLAWPAENGMRFFAHHQKAVVATLAQDATAATVRLADGHEILSQHVVLTLGNFPPAPDLRLSPAVRSHPGYHPNPWGPQALQNIAPHHAVLLIGSGLTAVDVLLGLAADGHHGPVTVVARSGRWPSVHGPLDRSYPSFYAQELTGLATVAEVVRVVRRHVRQAQQQGQDWRPVIDSLRPDLGRIWQAWPPAEQARFLRHVASIWSVVRHRSPPQNAAAVQQMLDAGIVEMQLGRVTHIEAQEADLRVTVAGRGQSQELLVQHVISCTGPLLDYSRIPDPLVGSLRAADQLVPDALHLGIRTDAHGALCNAQGQVSEVFYTLGPSRRPAYFESTAVPELRTQAAALAQHLHHIFEAD